MVSTVRNALTGEPALVPGIPEAVTFELDRRSTTVSYRAGDTLLQTARAAGLKAPSLCETGSCGTCIARLERGSARLLNNNALTQEEIDEGYVLTCQAIPTTTILHIVYE